MLRASGIASQEDLAYWWSTEAKVRVWAASHAESLGEEVVGDLGAMQEYLGPDAHVNEEAAELQTLKDRAVGLSDAAGIDVRNLSRRRKNWVLAPHTIDLGNVTVKRSAATAAPAPRGERSGAPDLAPGARFRRRRPTWRRRPLQSRNWSREPQKSPSS